MNILSLCDGISCGQIALNKLGIKIDNYYSSEIDKWAIKVTQNNYPNTIQLGDITLLNETNLPKDIDIILSGTPCQNLSSASKTRLGLEGEKSSLFYDFVRILEIIKPKYFLFENVLMEKKWEDEITSLLKVQPIFINSRLVSAQDRKRLYWTNIPNITLPEDKNISFSDICDDNGFAGGMRGRRIVDGKTRADYNKHIPIQQYIECRKDNKTNCLTTVQKDNIVVYEKVPRTHIKDIKYRWLSPTEYEKLQTVPVGYTDCVSDSQRRKMLGNGWTVDIIVHILSFIK